MESDPYIFGSEDLEFLNAAKLLLRKVLQWNRLTFAQLITVAKVSHVINRLPRPSSEIEYAKISVSSPEKSFGEIRTFHWWDVMIEGQSIRLSSGGHFYRPSTGGDTFTSVIWDAVPGVEAQLSDYSQQNAIVPDLRTYADGIESIDLPSGEYVVEVEDCDNVQLEDDQPAGSAEAAEDGAHSEDFVVVPVDESEKLLAKSIMRKEVLRREARYAYGAETCDFCQCDLSSRGLFVDGGLKGTLSAANMCIPCFKVRGRGIGWGKGQLYARQANGDWRLVGGFPPEDEQQDL
jgi:hypothetical protein